MGFFKDLLVAEMDNLRNKKAIAETEKELNRPLTPEQRWLLRRCLNLNSAVVRAEASGEDQTAEGQRIRAERLAAIERFTAQAEALDEKEA